MDFGEESLLWVCLYIFLGIDEQVSTHPREGINDRAKCDSTKVHLGEPERSLGLLPESGGGIAYRSMNNWFPTDASLKSPLS